MIVLNLCPPPGAQISRLEVKRDLKLLKVLKYGGRKIFKTPKASDPIYKKMEVNVDVK